MKSRWSYFSTKIEYLDETKAQALYYSDVVLPSYRDMLHEAKVNLSFFIEQHFDNYAIEIINELKIVHDMFKFSLELLQETYEDFSELMIDLNGYIEYGEEAHIFESNLSYIISLVDNVYTQIKLEAKKIAFSLNNFKEQTPWLN